MFVQQNWSYDQLSALLCKYLLQFLCLTLIRFLSLFFQLCLRTKGDSVRVAASSIIKMYPTGIIYHNTRIYLWDFSKGIYRILTRNEKKVAVFKKYILHMMFMIWAVTRIKSLCGICTRKYHPQRNPTTYHIAYK